MNRDKLFLLHPDFADPAYSCQRFYCEECVLLEGVLACFPDFADRIDVEHVAWPRPRTEVVELVGEENQSLPLLILADDAPAEFATGTYGSIRFVAGKAAILNVLSVRHGIPSPHP